MDSETARARLIVALGVLERIDEARAIATEAQATFADDPASSALIDEAISRAGLEQ